MASKAPLVQAEALFDDDGASEALEPSKAALDAATDAIELAKALRLVLLSLKARSDLAGLRTYQDRLAKELKSSRQSGSKVATGILTLASVEVEQEAPEQQQLKLKEVLTILQDSSERRLYGVALLTFANTKLRAGRPEEAERAVKDAAEVFAQLGDVRSEASAHQVLGEICAYSGALDEASREGLASLELLRKAGLRKAEANQLHSNARWQLLQGRAQEAVSLVTEALDILMEVNIFAAPSEIGVWKTLVQAHLKANNKKLAQKAAFDALDRSEEAQDLRSQGFAQLLLSSVFAQSGDVDKAIRAVGKAVFAFEDANDASGRGEALCVSSKLKGSLGLHDKALRDLQEALGVFEDMGDLLGQGRVLHQRSEIYFAKRDVAASLRCAVEARELFQDARDSAGEAAALLQLSAAEMASGHSDRAARMAEEAKLLFGDMDDMVGEASAELALMSVHMKSEQHDLAVKSGKRALALYREFGDRATDEVWTMAQISLAQMMSMAKKSEAGAMTTRALEEGASKAMSYAREALAIADASQDVNSRGLAHYALAHGHSVVGPSAAALREGAEAMGCFRETQNAPWEAQTWLLFANINILQLDQLDAAKDAAQEALKKAQELKDPSLEESGQKMLERIENAKKAKEAERRKAMAKMAAPPTAAAAPALADAAPAAEEAKPAAAKTAIQVQGLPDNLSPDMLAPMIADIAKQLIGDDEDLDVDVPLMEAGLTSNSAVLLRNSISNALPSVKLPATLSFDYPSISAISEMISDQLFSAVG
mmetsp:Transcript_1710/g.3569  ORF Transcript_1710/g.3569 Transcript_1710/m.3569 type:complete len:771 (-) Transcript_1710:12-2324(-)